MEDSPSTQPEKIKFPKIIKWHRIYYLLALLDVLIVVFGLFLNHHLISVQRESVATNEVWVNRLDKYLALRNFANKVSQPGDDVFANQDSQLERRNMEKYLVRYNNEFQSLLIQTEEISPRFRQQIISELRLIDGNVQEMAVQCRKVLSFYNQGDMQSAGVEMAVMDQMLGKVNNNLSVLHSNVIQIQHDLLTEESDYVSGVQKFELVTAVFVLLMVAVAVIYGGWIRKRIEEAAEEREKNIILQAAYDFRNNIIGSMADLMITVDDDGSILNVNQAFLNRMGYREDEIIGQPIRILTQSNTFLSEDEYRQMIKEKRLAEIEKDLYTKDGENFRCAVSSSLLKNHKTAAVIVAVDISRRIKDERKLKNYARRLEQSNREFKELASSYKEIVENLEESQNELTLVNKFTENVIDSMLDFLVVLDMDFNIVRVNPAALKLNGYEEHELLGQSVNILLTDKPFTKNGLDALRKSGGFTNLVKLNRCKDGSIVQITLSMFILKDEQGEEIGIVCVGKDISEIMNIRDDLEKSNEKLRQSNRELQDFAYVASHDLQEPLRKVQAFGDRLEKKFAASLSEEGRDYIERMRNAASRMQILINDLLTFSRITTKSKPFETVDINKIARDVVSDLEIRIEETSGSVEIEKLPVIDADPLQMRQLFQNIIGNALKFHRPGEPPQIKISSDFMNGSDKTVQINDSNYETQNPCQNVCQIVIQDNGIGFEEKYLDKIFTVFQRLHGRGSYEGSGIGLSVCRKIVERHGGEITAKSAPEKGSTFFVKLPIKQNQKENQSL